ncbi:CCA tRNA nucleotidyltransferase [Patescibacteria group bacterium]|nr:CCA tRNA nucleotidyltransferase [Patescibacteria group bacterium]MBU4057458.1 CCA tRNA nucleotidyltransferase [Patescibacteria group bacterium]MBU4115559.1 CCA tRNA nucleotidyltransferase [Patescibacteria group bacterium]
MQIPKEISQTTGKLENAGFEAYIVGGCVRDIFMNKEPKDWDITTNANPDQITSLFKHSHYDNNFGTVRVINDKTENEKLKVIEVTTYRLDANYSDSRRPDSVIFSQNLEDDLKRRDFTINALALKVSHETTNVLYETVVDLFGGIKDLNNGIIKTVGKADERFDEDALRILRAIRLSSELGFIINTETERSIKKMAQKIGLIAKERIRDEFIKIIMSDRPMFGIEMMNRLNLLKYTIPEIEEGLGIKQNQAHSYDVWEHSLRAVQVASNKKWPLEIRLAALFHDIGKPRTRRWSEEKEDWTFYGHEVIGSQMTEKILRNLKFPTKTTEKTVLLARWHMFFTDTDQITLSAVRRMLRNVGTENIWDLMNVRIADRVGTGRPKEDPYRLRKYKSMIEEVIRDPISVKMLKIDGNKIMDVSQETAGPKIGYILNALLEEALNDPKKNTESYLKKRALKLSKLDNETLQGLGEKGKEKMGVEEEREKKILRGKYGVK